MSVVGHLSMPPALLSLQTPADKFARPIHHAYLHPSTMARQHLSCNQAASLTAPPTSSTAPVLPCLVHVWPDASMPDDTVQLHSAAAATFAFTSVPAVHLTAVVSDACLTTLPAAVQLKVLRWLQPVTIQSALPASANTTAEKSTNSDREAEVAASIARQLWGRAVSAGMFTIVSILSQPHLLYVDSVTPTPSTASASALITPNTAIHCTATATSPAALVAVPAASPVADWAAHVTASFPTESATLHNFLNLHSHTSHTLSTASPALLVCGGSGTAKSTLLSVVGSAVSRGGGELYVRRLTCGELIASTGTTGDTSTALTEAWVECSRMQKRRGSGTAVLVIDDITPLLTTNNFPTLSSQLLALLDSASSSSSAPPLLIAACDDSQPIAPHWLRAGRFDEQLHMRPLNATQRHRVLEWLLMSSGLATSGTDLECVASRMHGCSVRQLVSVWRYATLLWTEEGMETGSGRQAENKAEITWKQWETAIQTVAPPTTSSSLLAPTSPASSASLQPTTADPCPLVGGYAALKKHLLLLLHSFLRPPHPTPTLATVARPTGILLHGPSGCGKSLLLASLAALSTTPAAVGGTPFGVVRLHVASVLSPYLGESERQLRAVFEAAKASAPCLLLVDDIDALAGSRDDGGGEAGEEGGATRLLTTLLVLLDGIDSSPTAPPVLVVATATSPATLDAALLRPGRLSSQLLVGLPSAEDRRAIARRIAEVDGVVWGEDGVEWEEMVRRTRGCSGAELCWLVRRSVWAAWREQRSVERQQQATQRVEMRNLRQAMEAIGCFD